VLHPSELSAADVTFPEQAVTKEMGLLDDLLDAGKDVAEQQLGQLLQQLGQDGLDSVIDRVLGSVKEAVVEAGLDPLPVPDINIPYSLDKLTGMCAPLLKDANSPAARILSALLSCLATSVKLEGELTLAEGLLAGLSQIRRRAPTTIKVEEGEAQLFASLSVPNLSCPFTVTDSNPDVKIPKMEASVNEISVNFDLAIPLDRSTSSTKQVAFDPPLDELPVEVDMDLGELGALEGIVRPLVVDPVRKRLVSALREEIVRIIREKAGGIGLASLLQQS
jgi:hypothetical protein